MGYKLKTPTTEDLNLISLQEARDWLRVTATEIDDAALTKMIKSARAYVERATQRAILTSTWEYFRDDFYYEVRGFSIFSSVIDLPVPPAQDVADIKYFDQDGTEQTLTKDTDFYFHQVGDFIKSQITPISGSWPSTDGRKGAVKMDIVAGWPAADVPEDLISAIELALGEEYETRQINSLGMRVERIENFQSIISPWKVE